MNYTHVKERVVANLITFTIVLGIASCLTLRIDRRPFTTTYRIGSLFC